MLRDNEMESFVLVKSPTGEKVAGVRCSQAAKKLVGTVILRSSSDEESRIAMKILRARSFAALRMTALGSFSAACWAGVA